MSLQKIIEVSTLVKLLKKDVINKEGVRLFDCSYSVGQKPDWKKFKEEYYGKFTKILSQPSPSKDMYLSAHIPQAVHMNIDAAMYPSKYERFALYPPDVFEKYIQMLGVNSGEHIIFYARGALGGMMHSAKCAWLLKSYGHDKYSVLNGGFDKWVKEKQETSTEDVKLPDGNWKARDMIAEYNIDFEELQTRGGGKQYMERTDIGTKKSILSWFQMLCDLWTCRQRYPDPSSSTDSRRVSFLDARPRGQFDGTEETGLDPQRVSGSHIPGYKNAPAAELVDENGVMKSPEEIRDFLTSSGCEPNQSVITNCNTGMQAAMLAFAIDYTCPDVTPRVYNGSMKEMELRDPKKISGGRVH